MYTAMVFIVYLLIQLTSSVEGTFTTLTKSQEEEDALSSRLRSLNEGEDVTHRDYLVKALIDETIKNYRHEYTVAMEDMKTWTLNKLKEQLEEYSLKTNGGSDVYIRWGSKSCPNGTEEIYSGYAAGSYRDHTGGSAAPVCLHGKPVMEKHKTTGQFTYIFGSEYQVGSPKEVQNHDVPCTVCRTKRRSTVLMAPGTNKCEDTWTNEYDGYLMSGHFTHKGNADFVCMDKKMDTVNGGHESKSGQLFYYVSPHSGSLKCPPYKVGDKYYLFCVVCSK